MTELSDAYLTIRDLAGYSGLGGTKLREYLKGENPIPHFKVGGKILIRRSEFDSWLEGFRVAGPSLGDSEVTRIVDDVVGRWRSDA